MGTSLEGKTALVTGGSRGVGRDTAERLAGAGADVVLTYRERDEAAAEVVGRIQELGSRAAALQVDLTGTADLDRFVEALVSTIGGWGRERLDVLVNNAGALRDGPFPTVTEEELDALYEINYKSVFFLTQRLLPHLADGGRIVNLGSGTSRLAFPPLVAYGPIKAAIESLTRYLAKELGPRGITVNAVAPGALETDFNAELFEAIEGARDYVAGSTALGRVGRASDVGGVIAFLASEDGAWINGARLDVSGGYQL